MRGGGEVAVEEGGGEVDIKEEEGREVAESGRGGGEGGSSLC